jgi:iron-sulfur cluster insertion protein
VIELTESAKKRIKDILFDKSPETFFRLRIQSGGCSGLQYIFLFDDQLTQDDRVFDVDTARFVVDDMSCAFLTHAIIDYVDELASSTFIVINPNAETGCGCGRSFSI